MLTLVVIAQDEEANIGYCLSSVAGWAGAIFVVDSFSSDATVRHAGQLGATVVQHQFVDWAAQRNWALENLPISTEWVLFLDADEQVTDALKKEIEEALKTAPTETAAFSVSHDFVFLGRHLRHAIESPPHTRLVRKTRAHWNCQGAREYCSVDGSTLNLRSRLWHEDYRGLSAWVSKHNRNATREAQLMLDRENPAGTDRAGPQGQERRLRGWIRDNLWARLPLLIRPLLYFGYRYLVRGGFLDGVPGLVFVVMHAFWYNFLVDAKYLELLASRTNRQLPSLLPETTGGGSQP